MFFVASHKVDEGIVAEIGWTRVDVSPPKYLFFFFQLSSLLRVAFWRTTAIPEQSKYS